MKGLLLKLNDSGAPADLPSAADPIAIIGAGPVGLAAALVFGRLGLPVALFERRGQEDITRTTGAERAIAITISHRGLAALQSLGLAAEFLRTAQPLRARAIYRAGRCRVESYGPRLDDRIFALTRGQVQALLFDAAARLPNVQLNFGQSFVGYRRETRDVHLRTAAGQDTPTLRVRGLIGADGVRSALRRLVDDEQGSVSRVVEHPWLYRSFTLPPDLATRAGMAPSLIHIVPGGDWMAIMIPLSDGTLSGLITRNSATSTWGSVLHELGAALPGGPMREVAAFAGRELAATRDDARLHTVQAPRWTDDHSVLLLGDAAHGVLPFYGQGLNASLEDCVALGRLVGTADAGLGEAFAAFEARRHPEAEALAQLSENHLNQLVGSASSLSQALRRKVEGLLDRLAPQLLPLPYRMVSNARFRYADASRALARRDRAWERVSSRRKSPSPVTERQH